MRLGFKLHFEHFWLDSFWEGLDMRRLGFDSIRYFLQFDFRNKIWQLNLSHSTHQSFSVFSFSWVELIIAPYWQHCTVRKVAAACGSLSVTVHFFAEFREDNTQWIKYEPLQTTSQHWKVCVRKYLSIPVTSASVASVRCLRLPEEGLQKQTKCLNYEICCCSLKCCYNRSSYNDTFLVP